MNNFFIWFTISEFLWILTRQQFPDRNLIRRLYHKIQNLGLDTRRLRVTDQKTCPKVTTARQDENRCQFNQQFGAKCNHCVLPEIAILFHHRSFSPKKLLYVLGHGLWAGHCAIKSYKNYLRTKVALLCCPIMLVKSTTGHLFMTSSTTNTHSRQLIRRHRHPQHCTGPQQHELLNDVTSFIGVVKNGISTEFDSRKNQ